MAMHGRRTAVSLLALLLVLGTRSDAAAQVSRCGLLKVKATGRKAARKLHCHAVGAVVGAVNPSCLARADARFDLAFADAESKGDCVVTGDAPSMGQVVDDFVTDVVTHVESARAAGSFEVRVLKAMRTAGACVARAIAKGLDRGESNTVECDERFASQMDPTRVSNTVRDEQGITPMSIAGASPEDSGVLRVAQAQVLRPCTGLGFRGFEWAAACVVQESDCDNVGNQVDQRSRDRCDGECLFLGQCTSPQRCGRATFGGTLRTTTRNPAGPLCPAGFPVHCFQRATWECGCGCQ
jgi:hypothetical protein